MNRRSVVAFTLAVASVFTTGAVQASPLSMHAPMQAMFGKTKMVKLSIRNDSAQAVTLKAGEDLVTIEAGKTKSLQLPVGTRIVTEVATPSHEAGTLVAQVAKDLEGATLALK